MKEENIILFNLFNFTSSVRFFFHYNSMLLLSRKTSHFCLCKCISGYKFNRSPDLRFGNGDLYGRSRLGYCMRSGRAIFYNHLYHINVL